MGRSLDHSEPTEPDMPERLRDDLTALYNAPVYVPGEVDDAICGLARRRFARRRRLRMVLRLAEVGAAAAAVGFVVWLGRSPDTPPRPTPVLVTADRPAPADHAAEGPGARTSATRARPLAAEHSELGTRNSEPGTRSPRLEARNSEPGTRNYLADVDGNGRVDILDAFALARRIEAEAPPNGKWDFTADGVVDRADVDVVGHAAVSLKKG